MKARLTTLFLLLALVLGGAAGVAQAAWAVVGSGSSTANAGVLVAATNVQASASGTTVTVTWTAPVGGIPSPTYSVTRSPAGGTCTGGAATTCTDTGVAPGNYTYTVRVVAGAWASAGATSNSVTVVAAPPTATTYSVKGMTDSSTGGSGTWTPRVDVLVQDNLGGAVSGVTVTLGFTGNKATTSSANCVTGAGGTCTVTFTAVGTTPAGQNQGTVTITSATGGLPLTYSAAGNSPTSVAVGALYSIKSVTQGAKSGAASGHWRARATLRVDDSLNVPLAGVTVTMRMTGKNGAPVVDRSCTTAATVGTCALDFGDIPNGDSPGTLTVVTVTGASPLRYDAGGNVAFPTLVK